MVADINYSVTNNSTVSVDNSKELSAYKNLKKSINSIIDCLNNFSSRVSAVENSMKSGYEINSNDADIVQRLIALKNESNKISNYLKNSIRPAIDRQIKKLS